VQEAVEIERVAGAAERHVVQPHGLQAQLHQNPAASMRWRRSSPVMIEVGGFAGS
jgi:hypothetical protein